MTRVLFVCLGNICRSPMAEAILRHKLVTRGLDRRYHVDSAGTGGWHAGEPADPRTLAVLSRRGVAHDGRARQVRSSDFHDFGHVLAMDRSNLANLQAVCPADLGDRLHLALAPTTGGEVPDPYYGGARGFDHVYDLLDAATERWLARWEAEAR